VAYQNYLQRVLSTTSNQSLLNHRDAGGRTGYKFLVYCFQLEFSERLKASTGSTAT